MDQDLTDWQALYAAFDPWAPVRGDRRADRGKWSPVSKLSRDLARPLGRRRVLLLGTQGSGKTTELLRLAEERSDRFFVVYIDLWRHMSEKVQDGPAVERLQPWEVLMLAGLAVHRAGREELGIQWAEGSERALADAIAALHQPPGAPAPTIDLGKLAGGLLVVASAVASLGPAVAGLGAAAAVAKVATVAAGTTALGAAVSGLKELAASVKWELPIGRRDAKALDAQDPAIRRLKDAVNALIGQVQTDHRPILLVLDGLDRVTRPEGVQRLFIDSSLLAEIEASTLVTASLTLRQPGVGGAVRGWDVRVMYSVPVLDHTHPEDRNIPGEGLPFFRELVELRHPDASRRIPEGVVDQLAWASGGLVRDFLHLVQSALGEAVDRGVDAVDEASATAAIDDRRRQMEGVSLLYSSDLALLAEVARTHTLPNDARISALMDGFCVLPYPNETEWWFPHPLLTLVKLRDRIGFAG